MVTFLKLYIKETALSAWLYTKSEYLHNSQTNISSSEKFNDANFNILIATFTTINITK